jgi:hypothetical protein
MADVFGRDDGGTAGTFLSEGGSTSVNGEGANLLLQNIQVTYQRPINFIFGLGDTKRYMVVGRAQGSFSIGRIVGPAPANANFLAAMADPCVNPNGANFNINMGGGCKQGQGANKVNLNLKGAFLTSVGYSIQAQDVMINENLQGVCASVSVA